jgi:3-deoxy-D-manno-octulosonic-acid transferase
VGATAWFHCASLGEFEQGRPLIEAFRKAHPDWNIVLTFFSPSGYEIRKNFPGADQVLYLPLDTRKNARRFVSMVNPSIVVFVKYEFWFRYLDTLYHKKIPTYIISANFRPDHHFFQWYGTWGLKQLRKVTRFFVQNDSSAELLRAKGIEQVTVSGDTRFDRVAAVVSNPGSFPLVEKFAGHLPVFLAGSTWPADEEILLKMMEKLGDRMKFIIAPHEVGRERVGSLQLAVGSGLLFSQLTEENASSARILIIDGIGYLSHLYQYATIAYIGGGFGAGIHNILEAAAFGKPVIFGPKYRKFREAVDLIHLGGAFLIETTEQLNNITIGLLDNQNSYDKASVTCRNYVADRSGATKVIMQSLVGSHESIEEE